LVVTDSRTLTVAEGVELQFEYSDLYVYGALVADGSASQPITFTADSASGWGGIFIASGATALLDYVTIESAGSSMGEVGRSLWIASPDVQLSNATIRYDGGDWQAPIYIDNMAGDPDISNLLLEDNNFNDFNAIELAGGTWIADRTLQPFGVLDYPYYLEGDLVITDSRTLTVAEGVELQFEYSDDLYVYGALVADGSASLPITFTAQGDPGDWGGIFIAPGAAALLDYVTIESAGSSIEMGPSLSIGEHKMGTVGSSLRIESSDVEVTNSTLRHTSGSNAAIYISEGAAPTIENNLITDNSTGIYVADGEPIIRNNAITGNSNVGIVNAFPLTTTVDARQNWWGDMSGPYHASANPAGQGDEVSDGVLFAPWLTLPPRESMAVSITGPITGQIGSNYTFTATVSPPTATIPITYVWEATDQAQVIHNAGITNSVTFGWNTSGTKFITVSATNASGSVSDRYTIIISSPSTATPTPTPTLTQSATATPTATGEPTATATGSPTATATGSPTATATGSPTATGLPTATSPTSTNTPTPTGTGTPPTNTPSPSPTATPTHTPTAAPSATAMIEPESGGELTSPDEMVQLNFPPGAVSGNTAVTYTEQLTPSTGTGSFLFAGTSFDISALDANGNPVTNFSQPFTITVIYTDTDWLNAGISDESQLNIYWWDGSDWVGLLPCAGCSHDLAGNRFIIVLDHLSEFALLGRQETQIYLPILQK
jgi:parallel beta-helix repeat protein